MTACLRISFIFNSSGSYRSNSKSHPSCLLLKMSSQNVPTYLIFHCTMGEMIRSISDCARQTVFKALDYPGKNFLRNLGERKKAGETELKGNEKEETLTQVICLSGEERWGMFQSS